MSVKSYHLERTFSPFQRRLNWLRYIHFTMTLITPLSHSLQDNLLMPPATTPTLFHSYFRAIGNIIEPPEKKNNWFLIWETCSPSLSLSLSLSLNRPMLLIQSKLKMEEGENRPSNRPTCDQLFSRGDTV